MIKVTYISYINGFNSVPMIEEMDRWTWCGDATFNEILDESLDESLVLEDVLFGEPYMTYVSTESTGEFSIAYLDILDRLCAEKIVERF